MFDIVKKNIVSVVENVMSTKLKFNFLKFLTMIKISKVNIFLLNV